MKVRHILGISGGKDSAALAVYMKQHYPDLGIEFYNSDTGCELAETEELIEKLSSVLGGIKRLRAVEDTNPFEFFLEKTGSFLPSPQQRWCTLRGLLKITFSCHCVVPCEVLCQDTKLMTLQN